MGSELRVGDVMTKKVIVVPLGSSVAEVAKLMKNHSVGSIIVVENTSTKRAKGIITERDIVYKAVSKGKNFSTINVEYIMSKPLRVITPHASLEEVAQTMRKNKIKRLPVVNDNHELVGIISEGDIMRIFPAVIDLLEERAAIQL